MMRRLLTSRIVPGVVLCAALLGAVSAWASQANDGIRQLEIGNKTRFLTVESVAELASIQVGQRSLRHFKVTVRNGYSLPVVAYAFEQQDADVGNGTTSAVERNGASVGWALAPNATDDIFLTAPAAGKVVINVAAVLLEDGTGDGEAIRLTRLEEVRAGVKVAYQQIIPLLQRATADQDSAADLQSLENEISTTLNQTTVRPNLQRGVVDAKNHLISELRQLQDEVRSGWKVEYRSEISRIKSRLEERVAKL